ncbi:hypothetical protein L596_028643 [Steinernema carpocapsae]|uniref:Uncharacterized protein n=1 Tax=Steinernema carpocapsae TaxID=34508 RepID=A0A4U5LZ25_STECR|nr:hypothetical protein L596_028643 [Steinernema carpocapsae]
MGPCASWFRRAASNTSFGVLDSNWKKRRIADWGVSETGTPAADLSPTFFNRLFLIFGRSGAYPLPNLQNHAFKLLELTAPRRFSAGDRQETFGPNSSNEVFLKSFQPYLNFPVLPFFKMFKHFPNYILSFKLKGYLVDKALLSSAN